MPNQLKENKPFLLRKENHYLWYILILPIYLICFFVEERLVKVEDCWVSYLPIDDKIPFLEGFVLPYELWYPMLMAIGICLLLWNHEGFKRYMTFIGLSFMTFIVYCALFPNMQPLRPAVFPRENFCTWLVGNLYAVDTNTNVCPSLHVVGSAAAIIGAFDCEKIRKKPWLLWGIVTLSVLISISTVFIKQHSLLDILVAIPYSLFFWVLVYRLPRWIKKRKSKTA